MGKRNRLELAVYVRAIERKTEKLKRAVETFEKTRDARDASGALFYARYLEMCVGNLIEDLIAGRSRSRR
jgi:hypothetical protein